MTKTVFVELPVKKSTYIATGCEISGTPKEHSFYLPFHYASHNAIQDGILYSTPLTAEKIKAKIEKAVEQAGHNEMMGTANLVNGDLALQISALQSRIDKACEDLQGIHHGIKNPDFDTYNGDEIRADINGVITNLKGEGESND